MCLVFIYDINVHYNYTTQLTCPYTLGYSQYVKDLKQEGDVDAEKIAEGPEYHISKAACYVEDAHAGRYWSILYKLVHCTYGTLVNNYKIVTLVNRRLANGKGKMSDMEDNIQLCFYIQTHAWWSRFVAQHCDNIMT